MTQWNDDLDDVVTFLDEWESPLKSDYADSHDARSSASSSEYIVPQSPVVSTGRSLPLSFGDLVQATTTSVFKPGSHVMLVAQ